MASFSLPWPFGRGGGGSKEGKRNRRTKNEEEEGSLEEFGVTQQLRDLVKGFTINTFKDFPLEDDRSVEGSNPSPSSSNLNKDLTDWQERHATLLLSNVKEISQLRYVLCPRHLKENQFWRIYFILVKSYVSPYEIRAIQKAKLRTMESQKEKSADKAAVEVEMTEGMHAGALSMTLRCGGDRGSDEGAGI